jgi:hypothetical protein
MFLSTEERVFISAQRLSERTAVTNRNQTNKIYIAVFIGK